MLYSAFLWRRGFQRDNWINYSLLAVAFVLHTVAMAKRGFSLQHCPVNNLYEATAFVLWTIAAGSLVFGLWPRLRFLGVFTSPLLFCVGVFALMPGLDPPPTGKPQFTNGWASLHAAMIMLGYGAFGLSAVAGSMFLTQERNLKFHRARALFTLLPPIQRLEKMITVSLATGLVLLTAGLGLGAEHPLPALQGLDPGGGDRNAPHRPMARQGQGRDRYRGGRPHHRLSADLCRARRDGLSGEI